jgi:tetratricopeptide (TPR) repeat protein
MGILLAVAFAIGSIPAAPAPNAAVGTLEREASAAWRESRFEDAIGAYRKALALMDAESPDAAAALNNIGEMQRVLGRLREAESSHRRALDWRVRIFGPVHAEVAASHNNLAEVLRAQHQFRAAAAEFREALAIAETAHGPSHAMTGVILTNLGQTLASDHRPREAEAALRRALAIWHAAPPAGAEAGVTLNNLGMLLTERGSYAEAGEVLRQAAAVCEEKLGPAHITTAAVWLNQAALERIGKRYPEARRLFEKALTVYAATLPSDHPNRTAALDAYASLLRQTGRGREAKVLMAEAREMRQRHARSNGAGMVVDARELAR